MVDRTEYGKTESNLLKADDIKEKRVKVTIESVEEITLPDFTTKEPVQKLLFNIKGAEKDYVPNKPAIKDMIEAYGPDDDAWVGKEVGLEYHYYDDFGKAGIVLTILDKEFDDDIPF